MDDTALQRLNMVESQVRPSDVTDRRIIRAMSDMPRERFVPAAIRSVAYMDGPAVVTEGEGPKRQLLAPRTLAQLIQLLEIDEGNTVLDIGCATGYSTAILARIARTVTALEEDAGLVERAKAALAELGVVNATVVKGPHHEGAAAEGPFDAILVNGAVDDIPPTLLDQLKDGGRLVAIRRDGSVGRATVWRRMAMRFDSRPVLDASAEPLAGFVRKPSFAF